MRYEKILVWKSRTEYAYLTRSVAIHYVAAYLIIQLANMLIIDR